MHAAGIVPLSPLGNSDFKLGHHQLGEKGNVAGCFTSATCIPLPARLYLPRTQQTSPRGFGMLPLRSSCWRTTCALTQGNTNPTRKEAVRFVEMEIEPTDRLGDRAPSLGVAALGRFDRLAGGAAPPCGSRSLWARLRIGRTSSSIPVSPRRRPSARPTSPRRAANSRRSATPAQLALQVHRCAGRRLRPSLLARDL